MNKIWFSITFILNAIVMKGILSVLKSIHFDSDLTAFMVSMAISIPFTLIAYWIFRKRLQYLNAEMSNFQLGSFVLMPIFWFLWIILYFQVMLQKPNDPTIGGSKKEHS